MSRAFFCLLFGLIVVTTPLRSGMAADAEITVTARVVHTCSITSPEADAADHGGLVARATEVVCTPTLRNEIRQHREPASGSGMPGPVGRDRVLITVAY